MKVALVHDWLTGMRGGERVLEVFCELYPDAPVFTLVHAPGSVSAAIERHPIHTSFLQRLPQIQRRYRNYLPLFPRAIEGLDVSGYDLLLSSSHAVAKGARKGPGAVHVCYCFTPMRYLWDRTDDYFAPGRMGLVPRTAARAVLPMLRRWDVATAPRVDHYVAISRTIQDRIRRAWGRDSTVIEPPVATDFFTPAGDGAGGDAYLVVSALVPYKRVDAVVEAFRGRPERLRVVGTGPDEERLRRGAPANVSFVGSLTDEQLRDEYRRCRALIHAAHEDFGISPIEAMACGRPVLGYRQGALSETVTVGESGLLFDEQTPSSIRASLDKMAQIPFNTSTIRRHAMRYSGNSFRERFATFVADCMNQRRSPGHRVSD